MLGAYWPHLLAVLVGAGLTFQVGMNATLGRVVGSPLWATVVNFCIGLAALLVCVVAFGARMAPGTIPQVPAWAWAGGLLGAAYVAAATVLGPRLGAMALLSLVLAGQLATALIVDHYGVLGFPRIDVTPVRLVGAGLVVVGALLVLRR
jgi:bacterial/archaeal transporter family-2 protein